ncbi:MAG: Mrp/NBP35 family ATP-binding protein [Phycisphaerae bacterium]
MPVSRDAVMAALATVQDPEIFKDIVSLDMVRDVNICGASVKVRVELTTPACPLKDRIREEVTTAVRRVPGVEAVEVELTAKVRSGAGPKQLLPQVRNIIAVGAGKGGVGKSTIALNLAVGLALQGASVGLLDGDVYGPSIPTMTGIGQRNPQLNGERIIPFSIGSAEAVIKVMSIGFIVPPEKALIWRGPMVHGVIRQFIEQVEWGELDYLIVDLPPGTGDVSLTLAQTIALTGAVIVATPQELALADARRAVRMFQQLGVSILGVVENMSYFICEHGTTYDLFGRGGAAAMAQNMGLPFLAEIPIDARMRQFADSGEPFANFAVDAPSRQVLLTLAQKLAGQVSVRNLTKPAGKEVKLEISG